MQPTLRPCPHSGCSALVARGRCDVHRRAERRPSPTVMGYGRAWEKVRAAVLREQQWCELCGEPATTVDHVRLRRRYPLALQGSTAAGGSDHRSNLRSLCSSCHGRSHRGDRR